MNLTENYLSIPKRLIADLRDNPLAIALYVLVARLYLIHKASVPLSRGDIRLCDPSLKVGAIKRAFDRLIELGWLIETKGYKNSYTPTWGMTRPGAPRSWAIGETCLGCPWDVWKSTIRIDRGLLDLFIGKCTPHLRLSAEITGYFVDSAGKHIALLQLKDIGNYVLAAAGIAVVITDALTSWNLIRDGKTQPIPADTVVLALASQRASAAGFQLSASAWRLLGWFDSTPKAQTAGQESTPLLFVPKEWIGQQIGQQIGQRIGYTQAKEKGSSPSGSTKNPFNQPAAIMTGIPSDQRDSRDHPPTPQAAGGGAHIEYQKAKASRAETESARTLRAFGIHNQVTLDSLKTIELQQIQEAITYAKAEQLGPGWVVTALRRFRDEGQPIPVVQRQFQVNWAEVAGQHGDLFKLGDDMSGLEEHAKPRYSDVDATAEVQAGMCLQYDRTYHRLIRRIRVRVGAHSTEIQCPTLDDRMQLLHSCMGGLRRIVVDLGLPATIQIVSGALTPSPSA